MDDLKSCFIYDIMKDSACEGKTKTLKKLLDEGFDVNHKYPDGSTLLHHACRNKHNEIIQLLLQNGADVNKLDKDGVTSLHIGIYPGVSKTWKKCLISNPYNEHLNKYLTLGHLSNFYEFLEDVKQNKADVIVKLSQLGDQDLGIMFNTRNEKGNSLLLTAFAHNHDQIAYSMMKLITKRMTSSFPLQHLEKIKKELSKMVDGLDHIGFDYNNMKYFSIISDNKKLNILTAFLTVIETKLQEAYAELLIKSCESNSLENVKKEILRAREYLIKNVSIKGIPYDVRYAMNQELKLENATFEKIKMILVYYTSREVLCRCVINSKTPDGSTPLQIAVKNNNLDIIKLLFEYGACLYDKFEPIIAPLGQKAHGFLSNLNDFFNSKGATINKFDMKTDKLVITNAISQFGYPMWFHFIGRPNDDIKLKLLSLIELDEKIILQKFIL